MTKYKATYPCELKNQGPWINQVYNIILTHPSGELHEQVNNTDLPQPSAHPSWVTVHSLTNSCKKGINWNKLTWTLGFGALDCDAVLVADWTGKETTSLSSFADGLESLAWSFPETPSPNPFPIGPLDIIVDFAEAEDVAVQLLLWSLGRTAEIALLTLPYAISILMTPSPTICTNFGSKFEL